MGRGHSGSTVLDSLIGASEGVFGIGELVAGMRRFDASCSCGARIQDCPTWTSIRRRFEEASGMRWEEAAEVVERQANIGRFVGTWVATAGHSEVDRLCRVTSSILTAISDVSRASVVVDSSKEISRALFLARFIDQTRVVHLVRNPTDMLASTLARIREGVGFRFMRRTFKLAYLAPLFLAVSSTAWLLGNLLAEAVAWRVGRGRVMRIRYEDLCADASAELRRIGRFAELDLSDVAATVTDGKPVSLGHRVAGNRLLKEKSVRFDPSRASSRRLPMSYAIMTRLFAWPLMLWYGYPVLTLRH